MYCVMRASVPSLYNVYRRYDMHLMLIGSLPLAMPPSIYTRCFLSAGSLASSPSKSRLVEAICIWLSDKITTLISVLQSRICQW